nr:MAG TPA: hypothetical protein [Caudoviricetes sp.]
MNYNIWLFICPVNLELFKFLEEFDTKKPFCWR